MLANFVHREHLGLLDEQVKSTQRAEGVRLLSDSQHQEVEVHDPACEQFYSSWCTIAIKNADIYEKVFGGRIVPTDRVLNYTQLKSYRVRTSAIRISHNPFPV